MTLPSYRHRRDTMHVDIPSQEDFRVLVARYGWTVRVYDLDLTDYPDGRRTVEIEGLHIRKDNRPGAHRRGGQWTCPEPLPANLAELVEDIRPGWYRQLPGGAPPGEVIPAKLLHLRDRFVPVDRLDDAVAEGWHWVVVHHTYAHGRGNYSTVVEFGGDQWTERLGPDELLYRFDGEAPS